MLMPNSVQMVLLSYQEVFDMLPTAFMSAIQYNTHCMAQNNINILEAGILNPGKVFPLNDFHFGW